MKRAIYALIVLTALSMAMAAESVVAVWTFDDGLASNGIKMNQRGKATLVEEAEHGKALNPAPENSKGPAGLILAGKTRSELLPAAFSWSMDVKYIAPVPFPEKGLRMYLLDCKYTKAGGLILLASVDAKGNAQLNVTVGTDKGVSSGKAKISALLDGKWHNLKVTGKYPKLELFMDGKSIGLFVLKGEIIPPEERLTIGDRVGSSYGPFRGLIDNVKLVKEVNE